MQRGDAWAPLARAPARRYRRALARPSRARPRGPAGEIAAAGGGGGALRLLARRPAGAARRAARPEPLPRRGHDRRLRRHRGAGRAQRARARPTSGWPPGWRRMPIDEIVAVWERQPLFADQSDALVEAQRPGRLSHDPRSLALLLRSAGQGALEPVWHELRAPRAAAAGGGGRARRALRARRRADGRLAPAGRAALVEHAGHAAHLQQPEAVAALLATSRAVARLSAISSTSTSASASSSTATPRPGPRGTASVPRAGAGSAARHPASNRLERGQPAGERELLRRRPAGARRRCPRGRRACSTGTAPGRASAPRAAPRARAEAAAGGAASRSPRRRRRSSTARRTSAGAGHRLVGRDRRGHALAHLGQLLERARTAAPRARGRAARARGSRAPPRPPTTRRWRPAAAPATGPTASRTAATRSTSSGSPTFTLKQA